MPRPYAVDRSRLGPFTAMTPTFAFTNVSMSRARSLLFRHSRDVCQTTTWSMERACTAARRASYPGRSAPWRALTSLSRNTWTIVQPDAAANSRASWSWRSTPRDSPLESSLILAYSATLVAVPVMLPW